MDRMEFINEINGMLKLVRTEYALTKDKMALILGISKKTLVESEKGRRCLGWTECVALASIFSGSHVLQNAFGGEVSDMLPALAFENLHVEYPSTMGGKVWWREISRTGEYLIQQNLISQHYRLLNGQDQKLISSFDLKEVTEYLEGITNI